MSYYEDNERMLDKIKKEFLKKRFIKKEAAVKLGMSPSEFSKCLKGTRNLSGPRVYMLAEYLEKHPSYFINIPTQSNKPKNK